MDLTIHHIHHVHMHDESSARVTQAKLDQLITIGRQLLMASAELKAAMREIDAETNNLSTRVDAILAKVGTGMSDAEVAEVTVEALAISARLKGIAKNPDEPIPA